MNIEYVVKKNIKWMNLVPWKFFEYFPHESLEDLVQKQEPILESAQRTEHHKIDVQEQFHFILHYSL